MKSKWWALVISWLPGILLAGIFCYSIVASYKELADPVNTLCRYWEGPFALAPYRSLEAVIYFFAPFVLLFFFLLGGVTFALWKMKKLTPTSAMIALALPVLVICISMGDPMALGPAYEQSYVHDCPKENALLGEVGRQSYRFLAIQ